MLLLLLLVAVWAGIQNALAGGGSFVTLPALIVSGLDARTANIASTLALFPGQVTTGLVGRKQVSGAAGLSFKTLTIISLAGGALGAALLLLTPSTFFARLVPWLVLFATGLFAYGSFVRKPGAEAGPRVGPRAAAVMQFLIATYGGYFGGGIGFLMLAALTAAGLAVRAAGATKNVLASVMNAAAVAIFLFTPGIPWLRVGVIAAGAMAGGYLGALLLKRVDERLIRGFVVLLGLALTVGLFLRQR
ncbi:sulfite exporter TauE/SafE family protein [Phenylobacterium hankyongense]|uniref:Probable membrane transporter protein n=1 Tax=Phenylobacterium hankyongense TaxID=1813876 RepID=A0A328B1P5_9CAUL|nr:sulfite exporter TauE/SafE family protein [Phenylobacterium hankyongense]RAK59764.1 sulfite exporter TauE/SafE family protein [Phenylobacterium hankyongense]